MSVERLSAVVEELLGAHELFRRLGFLPEDIFVNVHESDVGVLLRGDDGRQWTMIAGQADHKSLDHFRQEWTSAVHAWNETMTDDERQRIFDKAIAYVHWKNLLANMRQFKFQPKGGWSKGLEALSSVVGMWTSGNRRS